MGIVTLTRLTIKSESDGFHWGKADLGSEDGDNHKSSEIAKKIFGTDKLCPANVIRTLVLLVFSSVCKVYGIPRNSCKIIFITQLDS